MTIAILNDVKKNESVYLKNIVEIMFLPLRHYKLVI